MKKYNIIALVGESGTGKDTILKALSTLPANLKFNTIISTTTRPARVEEKQGVDYRFVSKKQFEKEIFLEKSSFNGWKYGTSTKALCEDCVNVGVFNPEGIRSLFQHPHVNQLIIYRIKTPGDIRILRQLERTVEPNAKEIVRRYYTDIADFKDFDEDFRLYYKLLDNVDALDIEINKVEIGKQIRLMNK